MNPNIYATLVTVLGATVAALSFLPYSWAHIVAGSLGAALAALHPVNLAISSAKASKPAL